MSTIPSCVSGCGFSRRAFFTAREELCCWCMPISEAFFIRLQSFTVADLLDLLIIVPVLLRAKLSGVSITYNDIEHSSLSGLRREATQTGRIERIGDPRNDPPLAYLTPRTRSRSRRAAQTMRQNQSSTNGPYPAASAAGATADGIRTYNYVRGVARAFRRRDSSSLSSSRSRSP